MTPISALFKPCYVYAPRTLVRRIGIAFAPDRRARRDIAVPWGATLRVNAREGIGRELYRQRVFDIAVSETAWRVLEPGDTAVDVGANIGYMTTLFAARVGRDGRVDAFEPHPRIFSELKRNVEAQRARYEVGAVHLHAYALGQRNGAARLCEPDAFATNEGAATLARSGSEQLAITSFSVPVARLDTVLNGARITLLKVDVEGFEHAVLTGAERLLAGRCIENVIYEAHDCERSAVHALLQRAGFCIFGLGHSLRGLNLTPGAGAPHVDHTWESPSYLATLHPERVLPRLRSTGWQVLKARR
jgi:FkbM family methyltransferase